MTFKNFKALKTFLNTYCTVCPVCGAYTDITYVAIDENICGNCYKIHNQIVDNIIKCI